MSLLLNMQHPESIAGIIFSPDRSSVLLILRRDVPVWVLPGGGIDPNETPESAIIREILEETGFQVTIARLVGHYYPINRLAKRTILYECTIQAGSMQSSTEETKGLSFFPLSNLPPMPPPYAEWIQDGLQAKPPVTKQLTSVNYPALLRQVLTHPILVARFVLARMGWTINT